MRYYIFLLIIMFITLPVRAESISVAVAGGFKPAMEQIKRQFERQNDETLLVSYASVGSLFAQMTQNAPFDVFISADVNSPSRLEGLGIGVEGTRFSYCESKLVLWSPQPDLVDSDGDVLRTRNFAHIAIANPKVGVHGRSAVEVLKNIGLYSSIEPMLVEGKNMLQTTQYVDIGVAELGFISWSMIYRKGQPVKGSYWMVPTNLYSPIVQQAQLLQRGKDKPGAKKLLAFLKSTEGKAIMNNYGYKTLALQAKN